MRTIKFRAWDKDSSEMFYTTETMNCYDQFFWFEKGELKLLMPVEEDHPEVRDAVMMQFTGLHDKLGKEIYEGDILGDWENVDGTMMQSRQTVFWHDTEAQYMLDCSFNQDRTDFFSLAGELRSFEYEIIGNIHEHSHLLE